MKYGKFSVCSGSGWRMGGGIIFEAMILSACSSGSSSPVAPTADASSGTVDALAIVFSPMYSANDGSHMYQVPASVDGVKNVTWSASDPSMVDLTPDTTPGSVLITTRKAGTVTITAQSGPLTGTATLTITQLTPDLWDVGNKRYNDGIVLRHVDSPMETDAGNPKEAACTECHGAQAHRLDIQHTPAQTGGYSDNDLINIFTKGVKPDGVPQRIMPNPMWHNIHQWQMTADEAQGVVAYLRSLTPVAQGPISLWNPHGHHDGGMPDMPGEAGAPPAPDAGTSTDAGVTGH